MDLINLIFYSLTAIISFVGLYIGVILYFMAKEEIKPGLKYFILAQNILTLTIIAILLFFYKIPSLLLAILLIAISLLLYIFKSKTIKNALYVFFGLFFYLVSESKELFVLLAVCIFIYSIFTGTVFSYLIKKKKKKTNIWISILTEYGLFLIIALIIPLLLILTS